MDEMAKSKEFLYRKGGKRKDELLYAISADFGSGKTIIDPVVTICDEILDMDDSQTGSIDFSA